MPRRGIHIHRTSTRYDYNAINNFTLCACPTVNLIRDINPVINAYCYFHFEAKLFKICEAIGENEVIYTLTLERSLD